jgi:hypothetical protein
MKYARSALQDDKVFLEACKLAKLPDDRIEGHADQGLVRQYRKWRRGAGLAWHFRFAARSIVS